MSQRFEIAHNFIRIRIYTRPAPIYDPADKKMVKNRKLVQRKIYLDQNFICKRIQI